MNIKRGLFVLTAIASLIYLSGCVSTKLPGEYNVDPEVLTAKGGTVDFTVTGTIPEKSFNKKAKVEFSPYVKYDNGKTKDLKTMVLRGEKTEGEGTVISTKTGGTFTYKDSFEYNDDMKDAELYVNAKIIKGGKTQEFNDIKLADGVIATYQNIIHNEKTSVAPSGYERETIIPQKATIYFRQNLHNLDWNMSLNKTDEAKKKINELDDFLMKGWEIKNVTIDAWASPEGEINFNDNLAVDRSETAKKYMEKKIDDITAKRAKKKGVKKEELEQDVKYIANGHGEDWDGFMKAVKNSNIPDKNTIINVVNAQSDANKREQEIRNMTVIYKEVEDQILPPLRRAEIVVNCYEPKRTDQEIAKLAVTSPDSLTYVELLHAATLTDDPKAKYNIYRAAFTKQDRDWKAYNNAAAEAIEMNMLDEANNLLDQASKLANNNGMIENNMGVIACRQEDYGKAETHFQNAQKYGEDEAYNLGIVMIQKGEYAKALTYFKNIDCDHNVALAQLLAGKMNNALNNLKCAPQNPKTFYMLAVYGARNGNGDMVYDNLGKAIKMDPSLKKKAAEDREFLKYYNEEAFKSLVH